MPDVAMNASDDYTLDQTSSPFLHKHINSQDTRMEMKEKDISTMKDLLTEATDKNADLDRENKELQEKLGKYRIVIQKMRAEKEKSSLK